MKKLLVLLLALTVVCGAAFAQAKVTGRVHADTEAKFSATPTATVGTEARLNFGWDSEDGTAGAFARAQTAGGDTEYSITPAVAGTPITVGDAVKFKTNDFKVNRAWAYAKFFDGMVKVTGGYNVKSYETWNGANTSSEWFGSYDSTFSGAVSGTGVYAEVVPVEGLSLVAGFLPNAALDIDDFQFQAGYSMADVANVKVDFMMKDSAPRVHVGFNLKAVENLRFTVVYDLNAGKNIVDAFVGYNVTDAIAVELVEIAKINDSSFDTALSFDYAVTDAVKVMVVGKYVAAAASSYCGSVGVKYGKSGADYQLAFAFDGAFKVKALTRVNF